MPDSAVEVESIRRFDGFDKLPFDELRACDTASRPKALSLSNGLKAPSGSRGLRSQLQDGEASTAEFRLVRVRRIISKWDEKSTKVFPRP